MLGFAAATDPYQTPLSQLLEIKHWPAGARGADGWQQMADDQGRVYYLNHNSGVTQWTPPAGVEAVPVAVAVATEESAYDPEYGQRAAPDSGSMSVSVKTIHAGQQGSVAELRLPSSADVAALRRGLGARGAQALSIICSGSVRTDDELLSALSDGSDVLQLVAIVAAPYHDDDVIL